MLVTIESDGISLGRDALATVRLRPGDQGRLGPAVGEPLEEYLLVARLSGDPYDIGTRVPLPGGETAWVVEDGGSETWGAVSLRREDGADD